MRTVHAVSLSALLLVAACNKPGPAPEAAVPATETADTVAAAGAPMADSVAVTDTVAVTDSVPADTVVADSMTADTLTAN